MTTQRPSRTLRPALRPVLLAACLALLPAVAGAEPSATNQAQPGLADTPVGPTALTPQDKALNHGQLRLDHGAALLDSDVVLKIYVNAWNGKPIDYSAILTPNTDDIVPSKPARPSAEERRQIDALVKAARAHPVVLIRIDSVALEHFDPAAGGFPIQNRLFVKGVSYYFDNSPYHYSYVDFANLNPMRCADAGLRQTIDEQITKYTQYAMDIEGKVVSGSGQGIDIAPTRVVLKDDLGAPLLTETSTP